MSSTTHNITPSLVGDPHHNLEKWTESVETIARSMCAMHDVTGALTLVMSDEKWTRMPVNVTNPTNPIDFAAGQPAVYRNRPAYAMPADHAGNANSAAVKIPRAWRQRGTTTSVLTAAPSPITVLLASLGEANEDTLRTTFPDLAPCMLDPRQIVDTMLAKHGVATEDDISKLLTPVVSAADVVVGPDQAHVYLFAC